MALTYTTLVSILVEYNEEDATEFLDRCPMFVEAAEDRLFRDLDTYGFVLHARASVSTGDPLVTKPSGIAIIKGLAWVSGSNIELLEKRTDEFVHLYWPDRASVGTPKFYAEWDSTTLILCPTNGNGTLEMSYVTKPSVLSSSNTTNWYTTNAERALVAAAMVEANLFMKSYETASMWDARYMEEVAKLRNEARRTRRDDNQANMNPQGGDTNLEEGKN